MLALVAVMFLVRVGPLCEPASAAVAHVSMSSMDGCPDGPSDPVKKAPSELCMTGCAALSPELGTGPAVITVSALAAWPTLARVMAGLVNGPAPPPPRG